MTLLLYILLSFGTPWQLYVRGEINADEFEFLMKAERELERMREMVKIKKARQF